MTTQPDIATTKPATPEQLLHDIITPLLTAKMNADLLAEHIAPILALLKGSNSAQLLLPEDENLIEALINAPAVISRNIATVQQKYRLLSNLLINENTVFTTENTTQKNSQKIANTTLNYILLVDDEAIHQDIGRNLLAPLYEITSAKNGLEAIQKCKEQRFDVILMDLQMPKMDGITATEELRKFIPADTMIIGLTSMPLGAKRVELMETGFNEFLEKPLKLETFKNLLKSFDS